MATAPDALITFDAESSRSGGTSHMVGGTLVGALAVYLFQVLGGRVLGAEEFAPISALWTLYFLGFTMLLLPIEQLVIRNLALARGDFGALRRTWRPIAAVLGLGTVAMALFVAFTIDDFFLGEAGFIPIAATVFVGYGVFVIGRGFLAGRFRFRAYGWVVAADGWLRLLLATAFLMVATNPLALGVAMVIAPWVILAARPFRGGRPPESRGVDHAPAGRFLGGLVVGTGAAQLILASGPLVVGALGATPAEVSIFFVTFTLFRSPLTASYNLLARVLPVFTVHAAGGGERVLRRWSVWLGGAGLALAALGAAVGAVAGPAVVDLLFDAEFRPDAALAAMAASGVVLSGVATFIGQVLVARGTTGSYATVWMIGLVAAVVTVILAGGSALNRTALGFVVGEAVALAATVVVVVRQLRVPVAPSP